MDLKYKKLTVHNSEDLLDLWGDPDVIRYTNIKEPCDLIAVKERIKRLAAFDTFSVALEDYKIGVVGCPCINAEKAAYGLFYQIKKNYWGKGIASVATEWMIHYMKGKYANPTFYADVVVNNIASERILVRRGFSCISQQVDSFERNGIKMDVHNYRL